MTPSRKATSSVKIRRTSARIKASIEYLSPFGFCERLSSAERSTSVAELSRGTVHVDGSEVVVDIESTVSFEVSLIGPEGFGEVSVCILAFPFENFLLTFKFVRPAEEPDRN